MTYLTDLYSALAGDTAITASVSNRIYLDIAPSTTAAPFLVYQVISTRSTTLHNRTRNLEFPSIQFSCWAKTKLEAVNLANSVLFLLDGCQPIGTSEISFVFSNQSGDYESDTKLFGERVELSGVCKK